MTKQEIRSSVENAIQTGLLKATPTSVLAGRGDVKVLIEGWKITEKPSPDMALLLLEAASFFVLVDDWSGRALVQ